jgi:choline dehydrogenase
MAVNGTRDNPIAAPRGKVVGGSSAINSCIALRPEPTDFEEWSSLAGTTWSWESVLPYFLKIENDFDFSNQFHSNSGPLPIRRWTEAELLPLSSAFIAACINEGFTFTEDLNYPNSSGVGVLPMNLINGQRQSATKIFLDTARVRDNLTIWSETTVDRIIFEGVRAIGVAVLRESRELIVSGKYDNFVCRYILHSYDSNEIWNRLFKRIRTTRHNYSRRSSRSRC